MRAYVHCAHQAGKTGASRVTSGIRPAVGWRGSHAAAVQGKSSLPPAAAAAGTNSSSRENPDLDEIVLDDAYYEEIGMTREQAMRQQQDVSGRGWGSLQQHAKS